MRLKLFDMTGVLCYGKKKISVKKSLDSDFFTRLFVSERKQIALMADANLRFASPHSQQVAQKWRLV